MKNMKKLLAALLVVVLAFGLAACGKASDGKTHLTFQIWDVNQRDGMQAVCDAYTAKNPDVAVDTGYELGRVLDQAGGSGHQ